MHRELYGREAVLDPHGLAARLVGLEPYGRGRVPFEHGEDPPVTVFTGGRGMGKTVLLKEVRNHYRGLTPLALLDCSAVEEPADHGAGWSPVTGALGELAVQLGRRADAVRAVPFPRLSLGLVAVTSVGWTREDDERARRDLLRLGPLLATVDAGRAAAASWVGNVLAKLAGTVAEAGAPFAGVVAEATVETVADEFFHRFRQAPEEWFGGYRNAGGRGRAGLQQLAVDFAQGGPRREEAEAFLVLTLTEDLLRAYTGLRRGSRVGRPLVLLDNAHEPVGRALVEPILRARADGRRDRTVVLAGSRLHDHEALRHATRLRLPETAHRAPCPRTGRVGSGLLAVELTPLTPTQTRAALDRHDASDLAPAALARAVHRLTGGRPLGVDLLARAAGEAPPAVRRGLTPAGLLDLTVELREDSAPVPVAPALLAALLPVPRPGPYAVLAAAHDEESARRLAQARLAAESLDGDVALRVRDRLRAEHWADHPRHFVGDPLLRALLLHRLRFEDGDHPGYSAWRAVHETLRRHYGPQPGPYRLHHDLALGDTAEAVAHLRLTFPGPDVLGWLGLLRFVAAAPYPRERGRTGPDPRRAVALGREADPALPDGLDPDSAELHLALRRLLHAVWLLTDPLALPDEEVADRLAHELRRLSGRHLTGSGPLWDAAGHWPRDIRAWRELSLPPGREDGV
ncbi:hypothetical protein [Streptomyces omiyaensis]|uniref:AAA+ ATPase domain-containing protein n=1 Tax=Streptomyces omiyaensis TaxID=68247 RepID=A0ABW7BZJ6_9ACTN|nr:hypothetical protein [Streptomyces omiyaensis]GGY69132.1 hypothetical protein GCM10010363_57920 [Streptomyces omiyaensis]